MSETEAFADLEVAQDLSKHVPENQNQGDFENLIANIDQKSSTEINVSYSDEAPTDLVHLVHTSLSLNALMIFIVY